MSTPGSVVRAAAGSAAGSGNALELRGVSRLFGALVALSDITMSVRPGERRAVLGSNGAGKTMNCPKNAQRSAKNFCLKSAAV